MPDTQHDFRQRLEILRLGVWDVQGNTILGSVKAHGFPIHRIAASPGSRLLATVGDIDVQLRKLLNGETIPLTDEITGLTNATFSPAGSILPLVRGIDGRGPGRIKESTRINAKAIDTGRAARLPVPA